MKHGEPLHVAGGPSWESHLSITAQSHLLSPAADRWRKSSGPNVQHWEVKQVFSHPDDRSSSMAEPWRNWDYQEQALSQFKESILLSIPRLAVLRETEFEVQKGERTFAGNVQEPFGEYTLKRPRPWPRLRSVVPRVVAVWGDEGWVSSLHF